MIRISVIFALLVAFQSSAREIVDIAAGTDMSCVLYPSEVKCIGEDGYGHRFRLKGLNNARLVDNYNDHTCLVDDDGAWCIGRNNYGQIDVPPFRELIDLQVGYGITCALDAIAGLQCWGDERIVNEVPRNTKPDAISVGPYSICALKDGKVQCYGFATSPIMMVPDDLGYVTELSAGARQTCVIADGEIRCWGTDFLLPPIRLTNPRGLATGGKHACVISDEGLICWGDNEYGQAQVPSHMVYGVSKVVASDEHTCAVRGETVECWGRNDTNEVSPPPPIVNPQMVESGRDHTCVKDDSGLQCWGNNVFGQATVPPSLGNIRSLFLSWGTSCAEDENGLLCWGKQGTEVNEIPRLKNVDSVAASGHQICIAVSDEPLRCYGSEQAPGELFGVKKLVTTGDRICALLADSIFCFGGGEVPHRYPNLKDISATYDFYCFLTDGKVQCEGRVPNDLELPTEQFTAPHSLSVGRFHICLIDEGVPQCWGNQFSTDVVNLPALGKVETLVSGDRYACAIDDLGIQCWGSGNLGEATLPVPWP